MPDIRAQYHFRKSGDDVFVWDVRRLVAQSEQLPIVRVAIGEIAELDESYWYSHGSPTCRSIAEHALLIEAADLSHPIILDSTKRVMDGMHRVCKALNLGMDTISAVRFVVDPKPDHVNVEPQDLPYD
ncbi:MAG: hypothetical protein ACR2PZ_01475 [Pseudomonadales bacterium]